jgi:hypothetical protein
MSVEVLDDGRKRISAPLSDEDVRALEIGDDQPAVLKRSWHGSYANRKETGCR